MLMLMLIHICYRYILGVMKDGMKTAKKALPETKQTLYYAEPQQIYNISA